MLSLAEIAARHTELGEPDLAHLRALRADWQLLADLSFSDLVLWLPTWSGSGWVAGGQIRPTTGPTVFADDVSRHLHAARAAADARHCAAAGPGGGRTAPGTRWRPRKRCRSAAETA